MALPPLATIALAVVSADFRREISGYHRHSRRRKCFGNRPSYPRTGTGYDRDFAVEPEQHGGIEVGGGHVSLQLCHGALNPRSVAGNRSRRCGRCDGAVLHQASA